MATGAVPGFVDSASVPLPSGCGIYLPAQSQASYCSASSSPLACHLSTGFEVDMKEVDVRVNVAVADGHADISASAVMTEIDDDGNEDDFDDTHGEALGASFRATPSLDLDLFFVPSCLPCVFLIVSLPCVAVCCSVLQ